MSRLADQQTELATLRAKLEEARAIAYVPNIWICDGCNLVMSREFFDPGSGEVGQPRVQEVPDCPNECGGTMARQTWRDNARGHDTACEALAARAEQAERERDEEKANRERAEKALEKESEKVADLRNLCARAYRAACKPDWEEGECLNEVTPDLHWEGVAVPELEAEQARLAAADEARAAAGEGE